MVKVKRWVSELEQTSVDNCFFSLAALAGRIWVKMDIWGITQQLRKVTGSLSLVGEMGRQSYQHKGMNKKRFLVPDIRDSNADIGQEP